MTRRRPDCWGLVPAAGVGRRVGADRPKQYLDLAGRPVIEHAVRPLLGHPRIHGLVVALDPADGYWQETQLADDPRVCRADGGAERCHSVLNALEFLAGRADPEDWVLVHDAARPCLRASDLDRLIATLEDDPVGGLLGVPVRDTIKESDDRGLAVRTLPRARLWHAYTPQMFRLGLLRQALRSALRAGHLVTDDASAVELLGLTPRLVEGQADNIKITRPEDLSLARFYLREQGRRC